MLTLSYNINEEETPLPLKECIDFFKENFFEMIGREDLKGKYWLAGGSLRDYFLENIPKDFDVYFKDENTFNVVKEYLTSVYGGTLVGENDISLVLEIDGHNFDLIKKFYNSPEQTLWSFDLSTSLCAVDEENLYIEEHYFTQLATKNIIVHDVHSPARTLKRILKLSSLGFSISDSELTRFLENIGVEKEEELKDLPKEIIITGTNSNLIILKKKFSILRKMKPKSVFWTPGGIAGRTTPVPLYKNKYNNGLTSTISTNSTNLPNGDTITTTAKITFT